MVFLIINASLWFKPRATKGARAAAIDRTAGSDTKAHGKRFSGLLGASELRFELRWEL